MKHKFNLGKLKLADADPDKDNDSMTHDPDMDEVSAMQPVHDVVARIKRHPIKKIGKK